LASATGTAGFWASRLLAYGRRGNGGETGRPRDGGRPAQWKGEPKGSQPSS
jgi:hypothetical protein